MESMERSNESAAPAEMAGDNMQQPNMQPYTMLFGFGDNRCLHHTPNPNGLAHSRVLDLRCSFLTAPLW